MDFDTQIPTFGTVHQRAFAVEMNNPNALLDEDFIWELVCNIITLVGSQ